MAAVRELRAGRHACRMATGAHAALWKRAQGRGTCASPRQAPAGNFTDSLARACLSAPKAAGGRLQLHAGGRWRHKGRGLAGATPTLIPPPRRVAETPRVVLEQLIAIKA